MKIFVIGLSRTGTHTLTDALEILGFSARHWDYTKTVLDYSGPEMRVVFDRIDPYDAFTDTPIARAYKELDRHYPGSKFILTTRNMESWLESCRDKFAHPRTQQDIGDKLDRELYGTNVFDEDKFRSAYERHEREVREYFRMRPEDLLIIDVVGGEGWEKLCPFLDRQVPQETFPKKDVSSRQGKARQANETIYFYVPEPELYADLPTTPTEYWPWILRHAVPLDGKLNWTVQTALFLRESGVSCNVTPTLPDAGIIVSHYDYLWNVKRQSARQFFVCVKPDRQKVLDFCNYHIAQNQEDPIVVSRWGWVIGTSYLPHWPQPSLIPRSAQRGAVFRNARYYGRLEELDPQVGDLSQDLAPLGVSWEVVPKTSWHDYSDTDVVIAVRGFDAKHVLKPASKLINAWLAGVPAILSPDSAYMRVRKGALDFMIAENRAAVIEAVARMQQNPSLVADMVANGRMRAKEFDAQAVTAEWIKVLDKSVRPRHAQWEKSDLRTHIQRRLSRRALAELGRRMRAVSENGVS